MSLARRVTCSCVLLMRKELRTLPFAVPSDLETNPVPFTVMARVLLPAKTPVGEIEVTTGTGLFTGLMVSVSELEVPPPGAGVTTRTVIVPGNRMSLGKTIVVKRPPLKKIVARGFPFNSTTDWGAKPLPFTERVKPGESAFTDMGLMLLT
jgi:hypothetical protein